MKFIFKPAPNYRSADKTQRIMLDVTIALLFVYAFSLYYAYTVSMNNVLNIVYLTIASLLTAFITEALFAGFMRKRIGDFISTSFPWIPSLILVLISPTNISIYAIVICTFMAIAFGKLVFGGFGNNIFNPAAVGRAVMASSFMASVSVDVVTSATPTSSMAGLGWVADATTFDSFIELFGGMSNMFIGLYPGAIGETSGLVILIAGIYLIARNAIDFRIPLVYLGTIFLGALAIGMYHGLGIYYPLFHVLTGGAMFGAFFMLTDPVTNPTTVAGRIIFALGAAFLTLLIRIQGNLPEGVLFSILLMNMMTPVIDRLLEGQQIFRNTKNIISIVTIFVIGMGITYAVGTTLVAKEDPNQYLTGPVVKLSDDFSSNNATIVQQDGDVYTVTTKGFVGDNTILVEYDGANVKSVSFKEFVDTPGIGDLTLSPYYLKHLVDVDYSDANVEIDTVASATVTSKSIVSAIKAVVAK